MVGDRERGGQSRRFDPEQVDEARASMFGRPKCESPGLARRAARVLAGCRNRPVAARHPSSPANSAGSPRRRFGRASDRRCNPPSLSIRHRARTAPDARDRGSGERQGRRGPGPDRSVARKAPFARRGKNNCPWRDNSWESLGASGPRMRRASAGAARPAELTTARHFSRIGSAPPMSSSTPPSISFPPRTGDFNAMTPPFNSKSACSDSI